MFVLFTVVALSMGNYHLPLSEHKNIEQCVSALDNIINEDSYCVFVDVKEKQPDGFIINKIDE